MGRRKIEIKAIKDDRNRSVTFLKRKGGLFKKAHELSVLCSVDVAVFIFGNNKKLYEYSSTDMRDLITRYQYHAGPSEHKGPSDFNAGNDDEEDEEGEGTPPHGHDGIDNTMLPPQFHGQPFPQIRHHTPSASPPIGNGSQFQPHPGHPAQRGHTPQPSIGSRPGSRNDMRRLGPGMVSQQPVGPPGAPHAGITFVPTPHIYNPPSHPQQPGMMSQQQPQQYSYPPQQNQMQHPQPYMDDRRASMPPAFSSQPPSQGIQSLVRPSPSPQPNHQQLPQNPIPQMSPPPPQQQHIQRRSLDPLPPPPVEPKTEPIERPMERPQPPLLKTDIAIKKLPQRKTHSIFTPIEENRSILSQHLASFTRELPKTESGVAAAAANAAASAANRSQSVDASSAARSNSISSPPVPQRSNTMSSDKSSNGHMPTIPETTFTPPSRSNSAKVGGAGGARPRGPRLTVQIPNDGSEAGGTPTAESISPRNPTETTTQVPQRNNSLVLPPPSPSASALLSAGATGPPNPFARPPPQQTVNGESVTPVSALPSRFLNSEFLPSPSSFYHDWPFRGPDGNSHLSPLNFATPVVGSGPSFLREENSGAGSTSNSNLSVVNSNPAANKRKTPEITTGPSEPPEPSVEPKRVKVE